MVATRGSTAWLISSATRSRNVCTMVASGGEADERQRRSRAEQDRPADLGAERLAIEDDLAGIAFDADLVGFLDVNPVQVSSPEPSADAGEERAQQRARPLLDRDKFEGAPAVAAEFPGQQ